MYFYTHSGRIKKTAKDLEIEKLISELLSEANEIELSGKISGDELPALEKAKRDVSFCVNELLAFFGEHSGNDTQREHLLDIIVGSVILGAMAIKTKSLTDLVRSELQKRQAKMASEIAKARSQDNTNKLVEAICAVAKSRNIPLAISTNFANLIRPDVRAFLGLDPKGDGYPSNSQIKSTVSAMKKRAKP